MQKDMMLHPVISNLITSRRHTVISPSANNYTPRKSFIPEQGLEPFITLRHKIHKDYLLKMGFSRNEALDPENQIGLRKILNILKQYRL